ncbi:MAG: beta-propeller fold lactonase family protein, partial [Gemmatimonas sp.]
ALHLSANGTLTPIAGSTRSLSAAATGPAQVSFDPSGDWLVVTEKATNKIDTWRVGSDGLASNRVVNASSGATPFGFTFIKHGVLVVTEAFGGAVDASAVSTYSINSNGTLSVISASVPTSETAACWIVGTNSGKFVFATNTGSASVSGFASKKGNLDLLDAGGKTANTGATPIDIAISTNSQFLYTLNAGAHTIAGFDVSQSKGDLSANGSASVPTGAVGLAAN